MEVKFLNGFLVGMLPFARRFVLRVIRPNTRYSVWNS